jgi:hypothetical protein
MLAHHKAKDDVRRGFEVRLVDEKWRSTVLGDADEVRKSDERRKIVAVLKEADDELTPMAIAKLAGMKAENVRVLVRKMAAGGDVLQPGSAITLRRPGVKPQASQLHSNPGYFDYSNTGITRVIGSL